MTKVLYLKKKKKKAKKQMISHKHYYLDDLALENIRAQAESLLYSLKQMALVSK